MAAERVKRARYVGAPAQRVDGFDKVTGRAVFGADMSAPNMLWGQVVRSQHPHALIRAIDASAALACDGVAAVLTASDVPGDIRFGVVVPHQPVLCSDRVRYMGDGVALVLAETREQAAEAARLVKADYQPLPAVFDVEEAMRDGAPLIHDDYPGNVVVHHRVRKGDVEAGFAQADLILERVYATQLVEHAYIEPEAVLALPGRGGGWRCAAPSRTPSLAGERWPGAGATPGQGEDRPVRHGRQLRRQGRGDVAMSARAALGALLTSRPVKMVNTREESLVEAQAPPLSHALQGGSHPRGAHHRHGDKDGCRRRGLRVSEPLRHLALHGTGHRAGEVPAVKTDILAAFTNSTYTGAMRGFGAPQAVFANESLMDEIALELGIDPVDVRRLNGYRQGSVTATGHKLDEHTVSLMEVIDRATEAAGWREKRQRLPLENRGKTIVRGIGMACSFRGCSLGPRASTPQAP